jgi:parallel beta-helix repeat protein
MHSISSLTLAVFVVFAAGAAPATAATRALACGGIKTITGEAARLNPGDVLQVSGTCVENVSIPADVQSITIQGLPGARIQAPATPSDAAVRIRGRAITLRNFTITGGSEGVQVLDGGFAWIHGNTIEANAGLGINVQFASTARIWDNIIQNNGDFGVFVGRSASALIGLSSVTASTPTPNTIVGNVNGGILVRGSAHAIIVANTISGNAGRGVLLTTGSHADIASNTIAGNNGDGIEAANNSTVSLGSNSGTALRDSPNSGSGNVGFGVRCTGGGYANGRIGALTGNAGAMDVASCSGTVNP